MGITVAVVYHCSNTTQHTEVVGPVSETDEVLDAIVDCCSPAIALTAKSGPVSGASICHQSDTVREVSRGCIRKIKAAAPTSIYPQQNQAETTASEEGPKR